MKKYELTSSNLMPTTEASRRWGYDPNYVRQMCQKYPDRFLVSQIRLCGTTYIIIHDCMEHLITKSEEESKWYQKYFKNR